MNSRRESQAIEESEIKLYARQSDSRKEVSTSPESPSREPPPQVIVMAVSSEKQELREAIESYEEQLVQRQQELILLEQSKKEALAKIKSSKIKKAAEIAGWQVKLARAKAELLKLQKKLMTLDIEEITQSNKSDNAIRLKQSQIGKVKKKLIQASWNQKYLNDNKKQEDKQKQQQLLRETLTLSQKMIQNLTVKNEEVKEEKMRLDRECQEFHDQLYNVQMHNKALLQKVPEKKEEFPNYSKQEQERGSKFGERKGSQHFEDVNISFRPYGGVPMGQSMAEHLHPLYTDPSLTNNLSWPNDALYSRQ